MYLIIVFHDELGTCMALMTWWALFSWGLFAYYKQVSNSAVQLTSDPKSGSKLEEIDGPNEVITICLNPEGPIDGKPIKLIWSLRLSKFNWPARPIDQTPNKLIDKKFPMGRVQVEYMTHSHDRYDSKHAMKLKTKSRRICRPKISMVKESWAVTNHFSRSAQVNTVRDHCTRRSKYIKEWPI